MPLEPGTRLGAYEISAFIGAGGMGEVYRARDTRLGREVAIKILPAGLSSDAERLLRFEQEARAAAALNHPNILAVYDLGTHESMPFIVSELLEGETLRERLSHGPLPVRKALELCLQIAQGLAAAHDNGIVHRDLKPENCFVTSDGRVKILDFGLAKLTEPNSAVTDVTSLPTTPPKTAAGLVLGTAGYMAPEQVRGQNVDHRADIFAFGAVLYEMLSGCRAFRGDTEIDAMTAILKEVPPDLPVVERHIPPVLVRIVDRCLEKAPGARFQTASDLAFALGGISSSAEAASSAGLAGARHERPTRRLTLERLAWIALAATLAGGLAFQARSGNDENDAEPPLVRFDIALPSESALSGPFDAFVSPNGQYVAFSATATISSIWTRAFAAKEARELPGTEGAGYIMWSPDSRFLAFSSQGTLKKVDISGGAPQVICDAPNLYGGSWNRNGDIIFAGGTGGLWIVRETDGQPVQLTTPDLSRGEVSHRWPQFLPDGRRFIYLVLPGNTVYLRSLDSQTNASLLTAESNAIYAAPGYLLFFRQGSLRAQRFDFARGGLVGEAVPISQDVSLAPLNAQVAVSVSDTGVLTYRPASRASAQLQWRDRTGKVTASVADLPSYQHVAISRDGKMAALSRTDGQRDLWLIELASGIRTKFTSGSYAETEPQWSPDGKELAFNSTRGGGARVFRKSTSGDEQETIVEEIPGTGRVEDWSADGRFLAYNFENDIWVMPLFGDRKPFRFFQSRSSEDEPQFSPDGRWVAYNSNESGPVEVYVRPFPGPGERVRISPQGGNQPRWRRDGRELFFLSPDGTLMVSDITYGGEGILPSPPRPLFKIEAPVSNATDPYAVAPDGQRFLVANYPKGTLSQPIEVVLNWTALLKK